MTVSADGFVFAERTSDDFGLIICEFDDSSDSDSASQVEFSLINSPIQNKWYKSGNSNYTEALAFSFSVAKDDFSAIDAYEYSAIARWLVRKDDFKDFMLTRRDYDNIHFYAQLNVSPIEIGGNIVGIDVEGTTNAPFGFSALETYTFDTNDGTTFSFSDNSDEIGYIYPDLKITVRTGGDISLLNQTENRAFTLKNCVANEVITIDGKTLQIDSTAVSHNIYEDSNYQYFRIVNDYDKRKNTIVITGDCTVEMKYRPIRKVVI